ncbi:MAG TPA: hypothetical protein VHE14_00905 [Solirubrobacteraceae bacterium]|nr:hypothetical protein [Solirubrobacteraceae bacterium]
MSLPFPAGFLIVAAAAGGLVPLTLLHELSGLEVLAPQVGAVTLYVLGVAFLGLVDDVFSGQSRGWRGHATLVAGGGFSTGALKAVGSLGFALLALAGRYEDKLHYLIAVLVLVLATNAFNLLDVRPGRSTKVFVLLGVGLTLGTLDAGPLGTLGLFVAPALVLGAYDMRERAMLGDTGSNLIGALAGLWLVLSLGTTGQLVALVLLAAVTAYGEYRPLSALIERNPLLSRLDSLGRPDA